MRIVGERAHSSLRERPASGPSLKAISAFFKKHRAKQGWSLKRLHKLYFDDQVPMPTLKAYLSGHVPDNPHIATRKAFLSAYDKARVSEHPDYLLYKLNLAKLKRPEPSEGEVARYCGEYETWRFTRKGLVHGKLRIGRHPESGIPYHWQEHQHRPSARLDPDHVFKYEGPIYLLARNVHLSAIGDGYFRNTKCLRVHDPRKQELVGMYLSEAFPNNTPFAVKVLFLHKEWLEVNRDKVTEEWIRGRLRNRAKRGKNGGQDRLAL